VVDEPGAGRKAGLHALLVLSLVSGLGGVVYEVLYMRHLSTVLGDMFYVHAALLGMFLLGNGIGAWIAHRFVRYLFAFEFVIGLYAIALPALIGAYETSFLANLFASPVGKSLFASALLLAVPSTCIGISIPLFSAYVRNKGERRDAFKIVYILYHLAAAVSVILVDFVLIRLVGYSVSLFTIGLANLSCGVILFARRKAWVPERAEPTVRSLDPLPGRHLLALLMASLGSAVFMGLYIKACYHLFLPQRENFAICTSISVLSIAIGTILVRRYRIGFSTLVASAMCSMVLIYSGLQWVVAAFHWSEDFAPWGWTDIPRELSFALLLSVPYVFLGATIPALLQRETDVARRSGSLLLVSGIGNAAGLLAFMFVAHPYLKVFTIPVLIWGLLVLALLLHSGFKLSVRQLLPLGASLALLPVVYLHSESDFYLLHQPPFPSAAVVHYKSASDNVSYVATPEYSYIRFNGQPSIFITGQPEEPRSAGRINFAEAVSGIIPAIFAPKRDDALVLGMGSGITPGASATVFRHTDVVEINAAFFPLVEAIGHVNFGLASSPAATIMHDDARSYLASTTKKYDAIVNSVPSPTYFAAGKIYTVEFLNMVKRALRPGGVYSGWFTPGDMSTDGVGTLFATLADRFEYCNLVVLRLGYYFSNCSDEPLVAKSGIDYPESVAQVLAGVRGVTLDEYFSSIVVSDDMFKFMDLSSRRLNTDDFPILEFQVTRLGRREWSVDPIVVAPTNFNIHFQAQDEKALLDKAVVLAQIHTPLFQTAYAPSIAANPELDKRFNDRMQSLFPEARRPGPR
jgi:predicted membrane-bound spermidine synthase